jgi:hypothetical protein
VLLERARQRRGAGVEHENARPVGVDELPGHGGVGHVGAHRGEGLAELGAQVSQGGAVACDPDDRRARPAERGGDAPAEPPAGAGDQRGRALNVIAWHNDSPGVLQFPPPVVWRLIDVDQSEFSESPRAGLQRAPASNRQQKRRFNGGRTAG